MVQGKSNLVEIAGELRHETEQAFLIFDGVRDVWLPKSLVEWDDAEGIAVMPEWLAIDKELL